MALAAQGRPVAEVWEAATEQHCRQLLPRLKWLLEEEGVTAEHLAAIAVGCGPGSFTGLRIGLATAKGLALGWGLPLVGVATLDAVAQNAVGLPGLICAVLPARRDTVYAACYRTTAGNSLQRVTDLRCGPPSLVTELCGSGDEPVFLVGTGAGLCRHLGEPFLDRRVYFLEGWSNYPRAAVICTLAWKKLLDGQAEGMALRPIYPEGAWTVTQA